MGMQACSEEEFIRLWAQFPTARALADHLKIGERNVLARRRRIEEKRGIELKAGPRNRPIIPTKPKIIRPANNIRTQIDLQEGIVIVGSDKHYWPGIISTAHRALVHLIKELQPSLYIANGDAFDGPTAGRHGRIMWEKRPSVKQELDAVQERMGEIGDAMGISKPLHWNWGNHDQRFNTKLAAQVPEFEGVHGFDLQDHFPEWKFGMSTLINSNTMIKHRWHNGIHAAYNNVMKSGLSMVTGHLHALQVRPYTDYTGTRYAVDTGTLANPFGPQFTYSEDTPANHRSGFAVLTYHKGKLLTPELVEVLNEEDGIVFFRGQVIEV